MKALIIHGFEGRGDSNFLPWLKNKLEKLNYEVFSPTLPNPDSPDYDECLSFLNNLVEDFGENDLILGHSLGGKFALKLSEKISLGKLILVAPVTYNNLDFEDIRKRWSGGSDIDSLEKITKIPINLEKIKAKSKLIMLSKNDEYIPLSTSNIFDESWKKIKIDGKGHFTEEIIPEIIEKIKELN